MKVISVGAVCTEGIAEVATRQTICVAAAAVSQVYTGGTCGWTQFASVVGRVRIHSYRTRILASSGAVVAELRLASVADDTCHGSVLGVSAVTTEGHTGSILEIVQTDTAITKRGAMAGNTLCRTLIAYMVALITVVADWTIVEALQGRDVRIRWVGTFFDAASVVICSVGLILQKTFKRTARQTGSEIVIGIAPRRTHFYARASGVVCVE